MPPSKTLSLVREVNQWVKCLLFDVRARIQNTHKARHIYNPTISTFGCKVDSGESRGACVSGSLAYEAANPETLSQARWKTRTDN